MARTARQGLGAGAVRGDRAVVGRHRRDDRGVESAEREAGRSAGVGVGTPGATSRGTGLIKNANRTVLIGLPLARDLSRRLGREVRLANDSDCFSLSEATDGAGCGARIVFGVILGIRAALRGAT